MEELRKIDLEKEYAPVANKQPVPRQPIALRNNLPIPVKKSKRRTVILLISAFLTHLRPISRQSLHGVQSKIKMWNLPRENLQKQNKS